MKIHVPRVTEILEFYSGVGRIPRDTLEKAALRGTNVHTICADIALGNWVSLGDEYRGYIQSFKQWFQTIQGCVLVEKRFTGHVKGKEDPYSGQIDYLVMDGAGKLAIADLKTAQTHRRTYPVQMAAYRHLLAGESYHVDKCTLVFLSRTGDAPTVIEYTDLTEEWDVFTHAYQCYKYFKCRHTEEPV